MATGFGVNYKAQQANWPTDIAYFKANNVVAIRPNLASLPVGWAPPGTLSQGSYEYWRNCAIYFAAQGFFVTWGPSGLTGVSTGTMTATQWTQYHDAVVADATYMQSQGIKLGAYELGNELESAIDGTTLTLAQLHANLRQLALDVKAVYTLSPISYSCFNNASLVYPEWIATGIGALDMLGLHPYSNIANSGRGISQGGFADIPKMIATFGSKCYITEFGLDSTNSNLLLMSNSLKVTAMRNRWQQLTTWGVPYVMAYSYVGYLNADDQFAFYKKDGSYDPTWEVFLEKGGRVQNINANIPN